MKKNKHDHKGTKALKLSIFFTLMLAPFLAVLFKCAYVTFNKNAYMSYANYSQVSNFDDDNLVITLSSNEVSNLTFDETGTYIKNNTLDYTNTYIKYENVDYTFNNYTNVRILYGQTDYVVFTLNNWIPNTSNNTFYLFHSGNATKITSEIKWYLNEATYFTIKDKMIIDLGIDVNNTLDNAFYYAIDEAMESPYFAWARTSALYTATSGLTNGMGITTQAIPTLIVYWLILTAIYIIIDIVIESFTYLTHCIMNRFD